VINTSAPFAVTSPDTEKSYWQTGSKVTVEWNVSKTNTAPISTANVDIYLSKDDGITWPYVLAQNVPNNGSTTVTVPMDAITTTARVKVKGANNVFFDMSNQGFEINQWPQSIENIPWASDVSVY